MRLGLQVKNNLYDFSLVLVYRLGGSSVDATLVEVNSGMFRIIASKVDLNLGGDSFDEILMDLFSQEFYRYVLSCS